VLHKWFRFKGKGEGLDTCYSAAYMSQTRDQQRFTISEKISRTPRVRRSENIKNNCTVLGELPPRPKFQPKVLGDLNPDFRGNPASDLDVCRIAPKMLCIHYHVSVSQLPSIVKIGR